MILTSDQSPIPTAPVSDLAELERALVIATLYISHHSVDLESQLRTSTPLSKGRHWQVSDQVTLSARTKLRDRANLTDDRWDSYASNGAKAKI